MKKTLLALSSALLLAAAGSAAAQTYYYDYGYGRDPQYYSYDSDRDGIQDRYDRNNTRDRDCDGIPNRFDRVDDRTYRARMSYVSPSRYVTPYGYRYQTYSVGNYLPRGYYGSSYYVDYRPYGLSAPPYGYQWVRVGNDVYMVRTSNGLINEIVYSLFR